MHAFALPGGKNDNIHELELGQTVRWAPLQRPEMAGFRQREAGEQSEAGATASPCFGFIISGPAEKS
ncbi:MAG: hypothetical protein V5B32_03380 [Candidatus Accumulibacter sp. UW26]